MHPFFDSLIFLYLLASAALAVGLFRDRKRTGTWEHKHPVVTRIALMLLCFSALVVAWGSFIEPRLITVNRVSIDLPNFEPTRPVRAALISDIQVGDYKKSGWVRRVARRIAQEKPDLVLLAGDIVQRKAEDAQYLTDFRLLPPAQRAGLRPGGTTDYRTYAVLGDHDYHVNQPHFKLDQNLANTVHQALTATGVQVLHNETRAIEMHGARFTLIGLDDWLARKTTFPPLGGGTPPPSGGPTVVLIHNPDFILSPDSTNADLILAGNTHGGQIRLPFIGPVARLPSKLPRSFDEGLFVQVRHSEHSEESREFQKVRDPSASPQDDAARRLFITSGIGESGPRARLFNPPEIALIELK